MRSRTVIDNGMIHTLCRQCAHHCGIYVHVKDGRIRKISGNKTHHENLGMVCPKGREVPGWDWGRVIEADRSENTVLSAIRV